MALRLLVLATAIGGALCHATSLTDYGSRSLASRLGSFRTGLQALQDLQSRSLLAPRFTNGYNNFNNGLNVGLNTPYDLPLQAPTLGLRPGFRGIQDGYIDTDIARNLARSQRCNCGFNEVCRKNSRGFSVCMPLNPRGLLNNRVCGLFRPSICMRRPVLGRVSKVVYTDGRCVERTISGALEECRCNGGTNGVFDTFQECREACQLSLFT